MPKKSNKAKSGLIQNGEFWQEVKVGDVVVYPEMTIKDSSYRLEAKVKVEMKRSRVKSITWDGTPGFAEVGAGMDMVLDDGKAFHGDSENGFHGLYKVAVQKRRR